MILLREINFTSWVTCARKFWVCCRLFRWDFFDLNSAQSSCDHSTDLCKGSSKSWSHQSLLKASQNSITNPTPLFLLHIKHLNKVSFVPLLHGFVLCPLLRTQRAFEQPQRLCTGSLLRNRPWLPLYCTPCVLSIEGHEIIPFLIFVFLPSWIIWAVTIHPPGAGFIPCSLIGCTILQEVPLVVIHNTDPAGLQGNAELH